VKQSVTEDEGRELAAAWAERTAIEQGLPPRVMDASSVRSCACWGWLNPSNQASSERTLAHRHRVASNSVTSNTECGRTERAGERQPNRRGSGIEVGEERLFAWCSRREPAVTSSARYCSKLLRTAGDGREPVLAFGLSPHSFQPLNHCLWSATAAGFWDAGVAHTEAPANFPHV
jgi:hypothetical protein